MESELTPQVELLPCPFCGQPAKLVNERLPEPFSKHEYLVQCTTIGVCYGKVPRSSETGFTYPQDAVEKWNTRQALAARGKGEDRDALVTRIRNGQKYWGESPSADQIADLVIDLTESLQTQLTTALERVREYERMLKILTNGSTSADELAELFESEAFQALSQVDGRE